MPTLLFDDATYQPQTLRDYQERAVTAIQEAWNAGEAAPLAALATGAGKTTIISELLRQAVNPHSERALVVGHTEEIIFQLRDRIANQFAGELDERFTDRYSPGIGIVMADNDAADARIVVATRQSLHPTRLQKLLLYGKFDYLLIDEAHHAAPGTTYLDIADALRAANDNLKIAGFTATPKRTDEHALAALWTSIAYQWLIPDGIATGYLVPVTRVKVTTEVDLSDVRSSHGDYTTTKMVSVLDTANWDELALRAYQQHIAPTDRLSLAFFPSVEMSQQFAERLRAQGVAAAHLDGNTPKDQRRAMLTEYKTGKLRVLSNFGVLCLDAETEILTTDGWIGIDGMSYKHKVANWDDGRIFFEEPKYIIRRERIWGERMVVLETPRRSIRVTEDHRMLFRKRHEERFSIIHAAELVGVEGALPISGIAEPLPFEPEQPAPLSQKEWGKRVRATSYTYRKQGMDATEAREAAEQAVNERQSLRYKAPSELTVDECHFIGFWIGDGTRTELQSGGVEYVVSQSKAYPAIIEWFDQVIWEMGVHGLRKERKAPVKHVRWSFPRGTGFGNQKRHGLFELEPYLKKDGTSLFWGLSQTQFEALLLGFWYADGDHVAGDNVPSSLRIHNTNHDLLSLLQAVAVCRGYRANITVGHNHVKNPAHSVIYKLSLSKRDCHEMTRYTLQFDKTTTYDERVWCVTSTTGNIITRRRGTVTVMGNTEGFDAPETAAILMARPTRSQTLFTQIVGRGLRPYPGKSDCLLIDLAVTDVRALEVGTLLGKMTMCKNCGIEHFAGLKACPQCGHIRPWKERLRDGAPVLETEASVGDKLLANYEALFEKSFAAWFNGGDGFFSCTLSFEDGALIIVPPLEDNYYRLALVPKDPARKVDFLTRNEDLSSLMLEADTRVRDKGNMSADKNAAWRDHPASMAQINLLGKMGVQVASGLSKGAASQLITHHIAVKRLMQE